MSCGEVPQTCHLLDSYPEEVGSVRGFVRIIPYLPGFIFREITWQASASFLGRGGVFPSRLGSALKKRCE